MLVKRNKGVLFFSGVLFILSSCSQRPVDPDPTFRKVQEDVKRRIGNRVSWNASSSTREKDASQVHDCIHEALQKELTVESAVQIALLNNQRLQATYETLGIAQADLVQAGLFKNPIFGISLRFENLVGSNHIIEMGLVQNLLDILLKPLKKKLASTELEFREKEVVGHVLDVVSDTKIAYYSLQALLQGVSLRKEMLMTQDARYDMARRLHKAKNITNLALSLEQAQYERAKIDLLSAEIATREAKEKLHVLMGLWGGQIDWKITTQFDEIPLQIDTADLENRVIANSVDLQMARKQMEATAVRLGIETKELVFPTIGVGIDSEFDSGQKGFIGPQGSIAIPFFDMGKAKEARGRAELMKLYNEYTAQALEIQSAAREVRFRLEHTFEQSRHYQDMLIPVVEKITFETLLQVNAMQMGAFDLLLAKHQEIETKLQAIFVFRDYWIARIEIEMLLSGRKKGMR